jgi:hypothetical protein
MIMELTGFRIDFLAAFHFRNDLRLPQSSSVSMQTGNPGCRPLIVLEMLSNSLLKMKSPKFHEATCSYAMSRSPYFATPPPQSGSLSVMKTASGVVGTGSATSMRNMRAMHGHLCSHLM